ncbi:hypothetical protein VTO42DRAFT_7218 [Malbranchea cinnamomea]
MYFSLSVGAAALVVANLFSRVVAVPVSNQDDCTSYYPLEALPKWQCNDDELGEIRAALEHLAKDPDAKASIPGELLVEVERCAHGDCSEEDILDLKEGLAETNLDEAKIQLWPWTGLYFNYNFDYPRRPKEPETPAADPPVGSPPLEETPAPSAAPSPAPSSALPSPAPSPEPDPEPEPTTAPVEPDPVDRFPGCPVCE